MPPLIHTASFYKPEHWRGDRYRISRAHPRGKVTDWLVQPFLYPSRELLREYRDGSIDFPGLDARYSIQLEKTLETEAGFGEWLESLKSGAEFTLLCFEPAGEPCHRRLAAAWLLEHVPELELGRMR